MKLRNKRVGGFEIRTPVRANHKAKMKGPTVESKHVQRFLKRTETSNMLLAAIELMNSM